MPGRQDEPISDEETGRLTEEADDLDDAMDAAEAGEDYPPEES